MDEEREVVGRCRFRRQEEGKLKEMRGRRMVLGWIGECEAGGGKGWSEFGREGRTGVEEDEV